MTDSKSTDAANIGYLRCDLMAEPSNPAAGFVYLYIGSDKLLYSKDDAGLVTGPITMAAAVILAPGTAVRNVIQPSADVLALTVEGHASATANLVELHSNGGTVLSSFSGAGWYKYGTGAATSPIHIDDEFTADAARVSLEIDTSWTPTTPTGTAQGQKISIEKLGAGNFAGSLIGLEIYADNGGTADITRVQALVIDASSTGSGTATTTYAAYITEAYTGGTITTAHGVYIEDQTNATNNYNIYTGAGDTVFNAANGAGNITFGVTPVSAHYDLMLAGQGVLGLKETTTPTADASHGKLYTQSDNKLYFQDGAGVEQTIATDIGTVVFNESGIADADIRIETDSEDHFLYIDSGANWMRVGDWDTNYTNWSVDGTQTMVGTARTKKIMDMPASGTGGGANKPTFDDNFPPFDGWLMSIDDELHYTFEIPYDCDTSEDLEIEIHWFIDRAYTDESGEVNWQIVYRALTEDGTEPVDSGGQTATITSGDVNIPGTAKSLLGTDVGAIIAANISDDDVIGVDLSRIALIDGNDPVGKEPIITAVHLTYTSNKLGEDIA